MRRVSAFAAAFTAASCALASVPTTRLDQTNETTPTSCADRPAVDATDYDTTQVNERPVLRNSPLIHYPEVATRNHITGHIVVAFVVSTVGIVDASSVRIINSAHPALDAEAIAYVTGSTYWPGCLNGKAVRVRLAVPIDFHIRS